MATQTITDAIVFPQDPGTSPNDGISFASDPPSGASWALHAQYQSGGGDYVLNAESGSLEFTVDDINNELTIDPGVAFIKQSAADLSVQSETGSTYDVPLTGNVEIVYAVVVPTSVTVGLDVDVTNDVYLRVDADTRNNAVVETGSGIAEPTDPYILLGSVDSTDGSVVSRPNDNPTGSYTTLDADSATITNTASAGTLDASDSLGNASYPTLSDVPTTLPAGTQVYVQDEQAIYVEDGL